MKVMDGQWTLFDYDYTTGRSVWHYFDGVQDHYRTDYPVENIVQDNQAYRNDMAGQSWGDGRRVASIPMNIFHEQLAEAHTEGDDKYLSRWLNDGDNRAFRTFEGRV